MSSSTKDSRLLLVLDDSEAALRAVRYVAQFIAQRKQFRICLVHVLPPLPPAMREHGGSGDPSEELRLDLAMRAEQTRWISTTKKRARKRLEQAGTILKKAAVPDSAIQTLFCETCEPEETADALLGMATECQCHTVVVGRQSVSWLHELFSQDISEELLLREKDSAFGPLSDAASAGLPAPLHRRRPHHRFRSMLSNNPFAGGRDCGMWSAIPVSAQNADCFPTECWTISNGILDRFQ